MRSLSIVTAVAMLLVVAAFAAVRRSAPDFYSGRPPLERPVPVQSVPRGLRSLSAAECGACHVAIHREWRQSVHAQAWVDPQFQAELRKEPSIAWLCINCHTPLTNQLDSLVVALADDDVARPTRRLNPAFDPALREEGITCASCHVRDGVVLGPRGHTAAPHPVRRDHAFLTTEICERCHQGVMAYPRKSFVCVFRTGDEWRAGPSAKAGRTCQSCHMPAIERPLVPGGPVRTGARHAWIGSHLPKGGEPDPALWDSLAALIPVGVRLAAAPAPAALPGAMAEWRVAAINANAGHLLPTGDPERAVIVTLAALDAHGDTLASATHRIGQHWIWYPEAVKVGDTRLAPGDSVAVTLRYRVPRGRHRLVATAVNERISDANADYHRLGAYPRRTEVARVVRDVH